MSIVFFVVYLIIAGFYFQRIYQPWGICDTDFTVFTRASRDLALKKEIYKSPYLETGKDYYKYSPLFALLMIPLSKIHPHLSVPIWYFSIFVFFMASSLFIKKILTSDGKQTSLAKSFYFLAILMSLRFLLSVIQRVQSDCLILFLLSAFILALFLDKNVLAGAVLAGAAMVKLTPLIFLPYLVLRKKFKAALACCLSILVYLFLPSAYVGVAGNWQYLKNWFAVHLANPSEYLLWYKNQSLLSCLMRLFSKDSPVAILRLDSGLALICFLILGLILFSLIFLLRRQSSISQDGFAYLVEVALVVICMIVLSPLAWKHTFVHLVIVHLVLLYYLFYINRRDKITLALVVGSFLINTMLNPELTQGFARIIQQYSNITWGSLLLYLALLRLSAQYANLNHRSHL